MVAEVINHYKGVLIQDRATLVEAIIVGGAFSNLLHATLTDGPNTFTGPRLSLKLLTHAYAAMDMHRTPELGEFIDTMITPMTGIVWNSEPITGSLTREQPVGKCSLVEGYVAQIFKQLRDPENPTLSTLKRISVYCDAADIPLAIRPTIPTRWSGAVLLRPVRTESVVPPATLVGLASSMNANPVGKPVKIGGCTYTTYRVNGPFKINPRRPLAAAYNKLLDQALYAIKDLGDGPSYLAQRGAIVTKYSLADYEAAAYQVMQLCDAI